VIDQVDQIGASVDAAKDNAVESLALDSAALDDAQAATEEAAPMISDGFLTHLVSGVDTLVGLASGLILGSLIIYYLLKDGTRLRRSVVAQTDPTIRDGVDGFIGDACRILRDYGRGRTVMSAVVSVVIGLTSLLLGLPLVLTIVVVNFVGGYIPYIGAFLGGGLAVIVALGEGGLGLAAIMLVVVLAANLILENFVEPKVMGRSLDIHPLVVLIVTALGVLLGGIVGLILAVPFFVIARSGIARLRSSGVVEKVADRAQPTLQHILD
jgi:predicted PurR-regulated permease PerM